MLLKFCGLQFGTCRVFFILNEWKEQQVQTIYVAQLYRKAFTIVFKGGGCFEFTFLIELISPYEVQLVKGSLLVIIHRVARCTLALTNMLSDWMSGEVCPCVASSGM